MTTAYRGPPSARSVMSRGAVSIDVRFGYERLCFHVRTDRDSILTSRIHRPERTVGANRKTVGAMLM